MPSHAEKNQTEIKNYYRIIDPEKRLSENEKAEEERRVLANMPACFPAALRYVMTRFGFTQEALAFELRKLTVIQVGNLQEYMRTKVSVEPR